MGNRTVSARPLRAAIQRKRNKETPNFSARLTRTATGGGRGTPNSAVRALRAQQGGGGDHLDQTAGNPNEQPGTE